MILILQILTTVTLVVFAYTTLIQYNNPNLIHYDGKPVRTTVRWLFLALWTVSWMFALYSVWT